MKVIYQTAVGVVIFLAFAIAISWSVTHFANALKIILGAVCLIFGGYFIGRTIFYKGESDEGSEPNAYWKKSRSHKVKN